MFSVQLIAISFAFWFLFVVWLAVDILFRCKLYYKLMSAKIPYNAYAV